MQKFFTHLVILLCALGFHSCFAANVLKTDTIEISNNGPVANLFHLARPDFVQHTDVKRTTFRSQLEITNYISSTIKEKDQFYIDGETLAFRNTLRYQFSRNLIISASLPWISHDGGFTDSFIFNFHDILQLPQNGRRQENEDDIRWILNRDGTNLIDINQRQVDFGDLSITARLTPESSPSAQWTFMTKLPTGEYKNHTGSNRIDLGLGFSEMNPKWFQNRAFLSEWHLSFWYGTSISYLGSVAALKSLDQNPFVMTLRSGFAYAYIPTWHLMCQFDVQSPLFNTDIRELGWVPIQISLSSKHVLTKDTAFEFAIMEDIRPRSVPDVTFQTTLETTF